MADVPGGGLGHDEMRDLCAAHALGVLDPPEAARLEAHLREGCASCQQELEGHRQGAAALAGLLGEARPPRSAEAAVLARLEAPGPAAGIAGPHRSSRPRRPWPWSGSLAAAALLVAAVALAVAWRAGERSASLVAENRFLHETIERAVASGVQAVELACPDGERRTHGWAFLDPGDAPGPDDDQVSVHVAFLDPPPADRVYQAWAVDGGVVQDLGTFAPDESGFGYTSRRMALPLAVEDFAVTVEPRGGGRSPSGRVVVSFRRAGSER